jgi:pimeloyl-ACP methyl ester carboxylesterase
VPGFISNVEETWDYPSAARWLERLGRFARVIAFDKRGTGLSDRAGSVPSLDERMDDARAVMDAAQSERAVLLGISEGGSLATLFAASHPDRCTSLILYGAFAKFSGWYPTEEKLAASIATSRSNGARARARASMLRRWLMMPVSRRFGHATSG